MLISGEHGAKRSLILHVDDLGMCHAANSAFLELAAARQVTCGAVMVPCPWFSEIVSAAAADDTLDLGVHLTLTSEWAHYRWRPVSTVSRASGLVDDDGYFHRDIPTLAQTLVPEAAELEMAAQIERAIAAGLRPSHIDAHMGAAMLPELVAAYVRLGVRYGVVPVLPRSYPDSPQYHSALAYLDDRDYPVVDHFVGTRWLAPDPVEPAYLDAINELPPGITHFALHATAPGDEIAAIAPDHAARTREYELLKRGPVSEHCVSVDVPVIGYRDLQRR